MAVDLVAMQCYPIMFITKQLRKEMASYVTPIMFHFTYMYLTRNLISSSRYPLVVVILQQYVILWRS